MAVYVPSFTPLRADSIPNNSTRVSYLAEGPLSGNFLALISRLIRRYRQLYYPTVHPL